MRLQCGQCSFGFEGTEAVISLGYFHCPQCGLRQAIGSASQTASWLVKQENGEVRNCNELQTLQTWIVTGQIGKDGTISRTGRNWKRLGDIPELDQFFRIVESEKTFSDGPSVGTLSSVPTKEAAFVESVVQPLPSEPDTEKDQLPVSPDFHEKIYPNREKDVAKWIVVASIALIAGSLAVIFLFVLNRKPKPSVVSKPVAAVVDAGAMEADADNSHIAESAIQAIRQMREDDLVDFSEPAENPQPEEWWAAVEAIAQAQNDYPTVTSLSRAHRAKLTKLKKRMDEDDTQSAAKNVALAWSSFLLGERNKNVSRYLSRIADSDPLASERDYLRSVLIHRGGDKALALRKTKALLGFAKDNNDHRIPLAVAVMALENGDIDLAKLHVTSVAQSAPDIDLVKALSKKLETATGVDPTLPLPPEIAVSSSSIAAIAPPPVVSQSSASSVLASSSSSSSSASKSYSELVASGKKEASLGNCKKAMTHFTAALDIDAAGVDALVGLGRCQLDRGRVSDAAANFRAVRAISSRNYGALDGLAEAYMAMGKRDRAIVVYQEIVDKFPGSQRAARAKKALDGLGASETN